jgi:hypothetical protein
MWLLVTGTDPGNAFFGRKIYSILLDFLKAGHGIWPRGSLSIHHEL